MIYDAMTYDEFVKYIKKSLATERLNRTSKNGRQTEGRFFCLGDFLERQLYSAKQQNSQTNSAGTGRYPSLLFYAHADNARSVFIRFI